MVKRSSILLLVDFVMVVSYPILLVTIINNLFIDEILLNSRHFYLCLVFVINLFLFFEAEFANLPLIPAFFEIGTDKFLHGVNVASSGSGCLVETKRGIVSNFFSFLL